MSTIDVMLCVNHPDNGQPTGRLCQVDIADLIHLEGPMDWEDDDLLGTTEFRRHKNLLKIGGVIFVHRGYGTWVGNWCWDAARMEPTEALCLLNHLKALGWSCHEAESSLYERWREAGGLTLRDLVAAGLEVVADDDRRPA